MNVTILDVFNSFIFNKRLAGLSPKTIKDYSEFCGYFVRFVRPDTLFSDISQDSINQYLSYLLDRNISRSTLSTYIRHVKIFLRWACEEHQGNYDVKYIKVPKSPKKVVRVYSDDEIRRMFETIQISTDWIRYRNCLLVALMLDSGLRQSELLTLKRSNIFVTENRMVVSGKGNKERVVPLGLISKRYMDLYMDACPYESKLLLVNRYGNGLSANAVKLLITKLATELPFDVSSHKLRHNFATNYCLDQYEKNGSVTN